MHSGSATAVTGTMARPRGLWPRADVDLVILVQLALMWCGMLAGLGWQAPSNVAVAVAVPQEAKVKDFLSTDVSLVVQSVAMDVAMLKKLAALGNVLKASASKAIHVLDDPIGEDGGKIVAAGEEREEEEKGGGDATTVDIEDGEADSDGEVEEETRASKGKKKKKGKRKNKKKKKASGKKKKKKKASGKKKKKKKASGKKKKKKRGESKSKSKKAKKKANKKAKKAKTDKVEKQKRKEKPAVVLDGERQKPLVWLKAVKRVLVAGDFQRAADELDALVLAHPRCTRLYDVYASAGIARAGMMHGNDALHFWQKAMTLAQTSMYVVPL